MPISRRSKLGLGTAAALAAGALMIPLQQASADEDTSAGVVDAGGAGVVDAGGDAAADAAGDAVPVAVRKRYPNDKFFEVSYRSVDISTPADVLVTPEGGGGFRLRSSLPMTVSGPGCSLEDANNLVCDSTVALGTFFLGAGDDVLTIEAKMINVVINGGPGNDKLTGGPGHEEFHAGAGEDSLDGGDGKDVLDGDEGVDVVHGGPDNDRLTDRAGEDALFGDAGDDFIFGGATVDGGEGKNTIPAFRDRPALSN